MEDFGKLLLRLVVGGLMLFHGIDKIRNFDGTIDFMQKTVVDAGMPEWVAFGVFVGEVLAPAMLILGVLTRVSALVIVVNMAMAVYLAHREHFMIVNEKSGAWALEVQAFYFFTALAIVFLGGGRIALTRRG